MRDTITRRPIRILMVEDDPADIELTQEALKSAEVELEWTVMNNGEDALDFLYALEGDRNAVRPDLILLDLNLPGIDGRQVLKRIKADARLKSIPVIVLSTSEDKEDIFKSYQMHANSYITKPVDYHQFEKVVKTIEKFWLTVVKLPQG